MQPPFLSIVIPAYNEERRILECLHQVTNYLAKCSYTWEVLVVDDGSTDGTASLVGRFAGEVPGVRLERVRHGGKGWAVKNGMLRARGQYRFMCDADLSMPIQQVERFLPPALKDYDIAIASREVKGARRLGEPFRRHLMGRVFNLLVRALALPGITDTQCGFKCFRGPVAQELFALQRYHGFSFDVEVLFLARRRGMNIREVPIDWYYRSMSKIHPLRDSLAMVRDIVRLRWNVLRGRYSQPAPEPEVPPLEQRSNGN